MDITLYTQLYVTRALTVVVLCIQRIELLPQSFKRLSRLYPDEDHDLGLQRLEGLDGCVEHRHDSHCLSGLFGKRMKDTPTWIGVH